MRSAIAKSRPLQLQLLQRQRLYSKPDPQTSQVSCQSSQSMARGGQSYVLFCVLACFLALAPSVWFHAWNNSRTARSRLSPFSVSMVCVSCHGKLAHVHVTSNSRCSGCEAAGVVGLRPRVPSQVRPKLESPNRKMVANGYAHGAHFSCRKPELFFF